MYEEGTVVGGRYRLVRRVGEGGMASIWKAEHLTLHSPVAVKFLLTGSRQDAETTQRFLREARAAAHVRHRNVIEINDFGITDDNVPYMVMEYLHGQSLAELLEEDPTVDPVEAVRIISLTLRGLAAVHDAGIVHRDLKPENLFLVADEDGVFPKLLDFGVARRVGLSSDITQEGALIGTPDYMSPEQARGHRDLDLRTDLYSMGVILYEMITGRLPFQAERVGDLIQKIAHETPPTVAELRPDLPEGLSDVVARAMAREREQRFADARQMRWALIEAAEVYGFRQTQSALISVSELPPPGGDEPGPGRKYSSGDVTLPKPAPTPSEGFDRAAMEEALSHGPTVRLEDDRSSDADGTSASDRTSSIPSKRTSRAPLYALLVLLAVGAAGSWAYVRGQLGSATDAPDLQASSQTPTGPQKWEPQQPGLPPGVLDAGVPDAGARIPVHLEGVPERARVHVDGVPVDAGGPFELPAFDHIYRIEVRNPEGEPLWTTPHPGTRGGTYLVWPAADSELQ